MVVLFLVTVLLIVLGIVIALGKGDFLIAGYNTASEEKKKKVNIKRLRALVSGMLFIITPITWMPHLMEGELANAQFHYVLIIVLVFAFLILANTWAKKK